MKYDVDEDYKFEYLEDGSFPILPENLTEVDELLILPNGKYLPTGEYYCPDGSTLIYEPKELDWRYQLAMEQDFTE